MDAVAATAHETGVIAAAFCSSVAKEESSGNSFRAVAASPFS